MNRSIPIKTSLGELSGRDCIFLDAIQFPNGSSVLVLEGEINGSLCDLPWNGKYIPYVLTFRGVMALKIIELDSWKWNGQTVSSFFEIEESSWIRELEGKVTIEHKHYLVVTYDDVFEVVCDQFEFRADQALTRATPRDQEITRGYDKIAQAERSGELTYKDLTNGDGLDLEDAATWKS
jgi:hypothetical protein